jgi:DNA-binding NarL/FixJ family response regulator
LTSSEGPAGGPVLVGDADPAFRAFASGILRRAGFRVLAVADGKQALELAFTEPPALALLDVNLPEVSGYEVLRELQDRYGDAVPTILVSAERKEAVDRVGGLLMGADDYLSKPCDPDELVARIRRSLRRGERERREATASRGLTARETEVLTLLARGMNQEAIASELVISPRTVATHIQHILVKLEVHSRTEAVALAHQEGLVGS